LYMANKLTDQISGADVPAEGPKGGSGSAAAATTDTKYYSEIVSFFKPRLETSAEDEDNFGEFLLEEQRALKILAEPKRAEGKQAADFSFALAELAGVTAATNPDIDSNKIGHAELDQENEQLHIKSKKLFLDSCAKVFPAAKGDFREWDATLKQLTDSLPQFTGVQSGYGKYINFLASNPRLVARQMDDLLYFVENSVRGWALYAFNLKLNKTIDADELRKEQEKVASAMEAIYKLQLMREELRKRLYGLKDVTKADERKIDTLRTELGLEGSSELSKETLASKKINLDRDGVFGALYDEKNKTVADMQRIVTAELKRSLLENMLKYVDHAIDQGKRLAEKNPNTIIDRKGVAQFCGVGMEIYQKVAVANEGRVIAADQIARMPMAEYLKKFLGYDLKKDKVRFEELQEYTNAFL